jgi:hypothetical protein
VIEHPEASAARAYLEAVQQGAIVGLDPVFNEEQACNAALGMLTQLFGQLSLPWLKKLLEARKQALELKKPWIDFRSD